MDWAVYQVGQLCITCKPASSTACRRRGLAAVYRGYNWYIIAFAVLYLVKLSIAYVSGTALYIWESLCSLETVLALLIYTQPLY